MKFKNSLANNKYSYRCKHRSCKTLLTISKEEVQKISKKEENQDIKYSINKEHTYSITKINKEIKSQHCIKDTELYKKGKSIIDINLDKPLNWHIKNLIANGINLKKKKIEDILYKDRAFILFN